MPSRLKTHLFYNMCDKKKTIWNLEEGWKYVDTTFFQWLGTPDMHNYAMNLKYARNC